jgi:hypothetical protein
MIDSPGLEFQNPVPVLPSFLFYASRFERPARGLDVCRRLRRSREGPSPLSPLPHQNLELRHFCWGSFDELPPAEGRFGTEADFMSLDSEMLIGYNCKLRLWKKRDSGFRRQEGWGNAEF